MAEETYSDDDRKHLDYLQGVISRLAGNQFLFKGWAITVAAALLGYAATNRNAAVAGIAVVVTGVFAGLDAYFLRQERLFRHVWKDAIARPRVIAPFDLNPSRHSSEVTYLKAQRDENGNRRPGVLFSPPIKFLYGTLVVVSFLIGAGILIGGHHHAHHDPAPAPTVSSPAQSPSVPAPSGSRSR